MCTGRTFAAVDPGRTQTGLCKKGAREATRHPAGNAGISWQLDAGGMRENVRDTPCLKLQFGKKSSQTLRLCKGRFYQNIQRFYGLCADIKFQVILLPKRKENRGLTDKLRKITGKMASKSLFFRPCCL